MNSVVVSGAFDDIRSWHIRFLQEAAGFGVLHVFLWDDGLIRLRTAGEPKFPQQERLYYLRAIRFVHHAELVGGHTNTDSLPTIPKAQRLMWVVHEQEDTAQKQAYCQANDIDYKVLKEQELAGFPDPALNLSTRKSRRKKVLVTGCFDWFHSGHVRFFEEASELGELYVVVGHDANIRKLKGQGRPMLPQEERRYMVQSIRYVKQALISTGHGWLDAEPEIRRIRPDIYLVNEDGDQPIKRRFCKKNGIEYVVLKRLPKAGLPKRDSTTLRGY